MIDEELDEDILNKKRSKKSVLKTVVTLLLIIVGVIILSVGNALGITAMYWVGIIIVCMSSCLINIRKTPKDPQTQTLSVVRCDKCNYTKVQDYKQGEFIFKEVDKCPKCDGMLRVQEIYSVKLKKEKS